jgi:tellurite methyltransferase
MSERRPPDPPSPFVEEWVRRVSTLPGLLDGPRRALDLAIGRGRNTRLLSETGWRIFGVDRDLNAVRAAVTTAATSGCRVAAWCADLTMSPLPRERFELIVVTRYLQRDLFAALRDALAPAGVMIYETFTVAQRRHGRGPTSPDHLLMPGELREEFSGFELLFYEEVTEPDAWARLCARKSVQTLRL